MSRKGMAAALMLGALLGLGACVHSDPVVPRPSVAYVPHPEAMDPLATVAQLRALYTTSPNRNPQGLGLYEYMWPQSRMTLMSWPFQERVEALNRIAFRRTLEQQRQVLAERRALFEEHLVFWGMLYSANRFPVEPEWYLPEGVYLEDDQGRVFRPTAVRQASPRFFFEDYYRSAQHAADSPLEVSYPELVFPREALTPRTRALTLYLAAVQRQLSFTWVFDETYVPVFDRYDPEHGVGMERLLRTRPATP